LSTLQSVKNIKNEADAIYEELASKKPHTKISLGIDAQAAITLYAKESKKRMESLNYIMNDALRSEDKARIEPFYLFIKLFTHSLYSLPSIPASVWHCVATDLHYKKDEFVTWWAFTSCTQDMSQLGIGDFLGKGAKTLLNITLKNGFDISLFSSSKEKEILVPPSKFQVTDSIKAGDSLYIIELVQLPQNDPLFIDL